MSEELFRKLLLTVARHYDVSPKDVLSETRLANIAMARHMVFFVGSQILGLKQAHLAKALHRHKSVAVNSIQRVRYKLSADQRTCFDVAQIMGKMT